MNLGIMAGERRAALAKAAELSEQKRLLVGASLVLILLQLVRRGSGMGLPGEF